VAVHVYGGDAASNVIEGGVDSIEHGWDLTDDMLRTMKEKGMYLVGTDFPYEHLVALGAVGPEDPKILSKKIIDRLGRAYKIGTKLAFGSDVVSELPGENRADMTFDYLKVWRAAGIPPAEILKAMTTNCAELLGIQKTRGAIAAGQAADIIATPGNPLENIETLRNVNFVMKDGKVIRQ
jgi:imidazolonepropionase-like amidohydrolase